MARPKPAAAARPHRQMAEIRQARWSPRGRHSGGRADGRLPVATGVGNDPGGVRGRTWEAFWRVSVGGQSPADVGRRPGHERGGSLQGQIACSRPVPARCFGSCRRDLAELKWCQARALYSKRERSITSAVEQPMQARGGAGCGRATGPAGRRTAALLLQRSRRAGCRPGKTPQNEVFAFRKGSTMITSTCPSRETLFQYSVGALDGRTTRRLGRAPRLLPRLPGDDRDPGRRRRHGGRSPADCR